jgi:hypothetical protein
MVFRVIKNLLGGNNRPGSADKRIIIGVKPLIYHLLKDYVAETGHWMQYAAEHLIRLGIATEQKLNNLHLLEEDLNDSMPIRSHLKERRYIAVNRQLHYLIKGYGLRHSMTVKTATEHLICLGIVAEDAIDELESNETIKDRGKKVMRKSRK